VASTANRANPRDHGNLLDTLYVYPSGEPRRRTRRDALRTKDWSAMKAAARHAVIVLAGILIGSVLPVAIAPGKASALPAGLPELPNLGEAMQRDNRTGLALSGFDPVAYFLNDAAVPGSADYELIHDGAVWRFASAANRDAFREAPEVYTPRFGGFDASGVADGRAVDADPHRFAVIGAKLYFFRNDENRRRFLAEAALRAKAQQRWPAIATSIAR
jgi:YHS domain-containing protein